MANRAVTATRRLLIEGLKLKRGRVAVEINRAIAPKVNGINDDRAGRRRRNRQFRRRR
jgi:hypothetical protein